MTLDELPLATPSPITTVGGDRPLRLRLMELGLIPGTRVEVVRIAPLGDPMELRVRSGRLSIRRHEARHIEVYG